MNTMRSLRIFGLFLFMLAGISLPDKVQAQPGYRISFQTFYDELSPYGRWTRNPQYGSVWIPDVPAGFQPYSTQGYWEVTEYGNTWVSDYDWGWAPFHYGRWSFDDYVGWFWIPDYEWGPAWVNWRSGGGYYGWAPLGPGMNFNVSVNIPSFWWVFIPQRYISSPRWYNYCAPRNRVSHYYNQTVIINNYYENNNRTYVYGPRRDEIERVTRREVPVRTIDASPSGRGRVIVAGNSRGNDRYEPSGNSRNNGAGNRNSTIDAGGNRGNDNYNPYNGNRNNSSGNGRVNGSTENSRRDNSPAIRNGSPSERNNSDFNRGRTAEPVNPSENRNNSDFNRGRTAEPVNPSENRNNTDFNRGRTAEPASPSENRSNRGYEAPRSSFPSREQSVPSYGTERSNRSERSAEPANRSQQRIPDNVSSPRESQPQRSAPESRTSAPANRSGNENPGRGSGGATERSSRSPR